MRKAGPTANARLEYIFRTTLSRKPTAGEQKRLVKLYEEQLSHYLAEPNEAKQLIEVGESCADKSVSVAELAACTIVANVIFNLEEFGTR